MVYTAWPHVYIASSQCQGHSNHFDHVLRKKRVRGNIFYYST